MPAGAIGRRITLEFDGVFQDAVVWVNGQKAGRHVGGYTGFSVDITPYVLAGGKLLAVHVNNEWNARIAPRAGEHVLSGGIYRNVRLVITDPVHVAWYGTFVTTPQVSDEWATVRVQTEVRNDRNDSAGGPAKVELVSEVLDAGGRQVAVRRSERVVAAADTATYDQMLPRIGRPELWSPDQPYLYTLVSSLLVDGKHLYVIGANVHQDHAGWGDGAADAAASSQNHDSPPAAKWSKQ